MHEFQGNIWCIEPSGWHEKPYEGDKLQEIESFYNIALKQHTTGLLELCNENTNTSNNSLITTFGKLFSEINIKGKGIEEFLCLTNDNSFPDIFDSITRQKETNLLPDHIIIRHQSILPVRLNRLYSFLRKEKEIKSFIPMNIFQKGGYERLKKIFQTIDSNLLGRKNNQYKLYSTYAYSWIHDKPLKEIITDYHSFNKNKQVNTSIRNVLEIIEDHIRFEYVINANAYIDILKLVLKEKGIAEDEQNIPNLPLFLECGSGNPTAINLMALGLSRLTSIKLIKSKQFYCDESPTATDCFNALQNISVEHLDVPSVCKNEIKQLIQ